jgi:hypothetical protein
MNGEQLFAKSLLQLAKESKTEFLDIAKLDNKIIDAAKKIGLKLPNPDISVFRTVWAEIDKKNLNGVRLTRKVVEEGLKTILFKQVNWEHEGSGYVCGLTIDAEIEDDKIITTNIIYKSLFPDKFEELKEKIKSGEAAVSFEIWSINPETKESVIKIAKDGIKEFTQMIIHGTGLLLVAPPACPNAKVFSLIAQKEIENAEKIVENIFNENLIYASLAVGNLHDNSEKKEDNIVDKQEEQKAITSEETKVEKTQPETKAEEKKVEEKTEVVETKVVENKTEETKEETTPQETQKAESDTKVEEKVEEKKEEKAQEMETVVPKIVVKVTRTYSDIYVDTYVDGTISGTSEGKSHSKTVTEYKDGTQDVIESESEYKKKYDFAEVEEKVNAAKAEKDAEIATLKGEHTKQIEAKDAEIKNTKKELGKRDQEIADLKVKKEIEVAKAASEEFVVGNTDIEVKSDIKKQADNINKIIAEKHQQN